MPYPEDIPTRVISFGSANVLEDGGALRLRVTVTGSRSLVRDLTGARWENRGVTAVSGPGEAVTLEVPVTDAPGWRDAATQALLDVSAPGSYTHRYTAVLELLVGERVVGKPFTLGPFVVPAGDGTPLDMDKALVVGTTVADQVLIPDTWSAEVAAAEAAAISAALSAESAAASVDDVAAISERVWNVTTAAQIPGAIAAIVAAGGGTLRVPPHATITLDATVALPNEVRALIVDGKVTASGDFTMFTRMGTYAGTGQFSYLTANMLAKDRAFTPADASIFQPEDWVWIASTDVIPRSTDKRGYMRKVLSVSGGVVQVDAPVPRDLTLLGTARAYRINMTPSFRLGGGGEVYYPDQTNKSSMFVFRWVHGLTVERGLRLHTGGGPCIGLQHVVDFDIRATIERFKNDVDNGYVGYGISCGGACRDGFVGGRIGRCRHAFTTVTGPIGAGMPLSYAGEPENIIVAPRTFRCGDKALDTHVPGWGIRLHLRDIGSGGGIHIRSDATHGYGEADGLTAPLVQYDEGPYVVPATFGALSCTGTKLGDASWAVFSIEADAVFQSFPEATWDGVTGSLWKIAPGVRLTLPSASTLVVTTADVNAADTILVDVTELTVPVKKGGIYLLDAYLITTANQATDLSLAWVAPAGSTMDWTSNGPATSVSSTSAQITRNNVAAPETVTNIGGQADATPMVATPKGRLVAGADGVLTLRFAQAAANATPARVRAGSWLRLDRVR